MTRILIAEDEPAIANFLAKKLRQQGFGTKIAADGYSALYESLSHNFDLLILDLGLPGKDGVEVMEELRGQGERIPIIILTARTNVKDRVSGLQGGADDYVTKPFSFEELLARINLRLRSRQAVTPEPETILKVGEITLDLHSRTVKIGDRDLHLSNQEFILLENFMRHPDRVLSREELLNYVWGYNYDCDSNIVDVYVGYLRKKLGHSAIETVRGVGYRLPTG